MAFPVLIALGLLALSMAATYYLRPDTSTEKMRAASLSDFGAPRAVDGDALPLVYGTMRLRSPALVWFGDLEATPITVDGGVLSEDQLVGYRYDVSMRLILCRGNTPVSETGQFAGARFNALYIGDKKVRFLSTTEATYGFTAEIEDDDAPGGNLQGHMYFYRGRWDQQLMGGFGVYAVDRGTTPEEAADTTPPYRGQVMLSLRQWYCAQPSLPLISAVVTNPITIPGYETETAPIGADQANPAAVIYDLLTNAWGGVGSSTSDIDLTSFVAVAETLRDEQHGISIALARTTDARQVIEDVLRQIDGVLYQEPTTRKYVLRLIREDYTLGLLPILDESNIVGQPKLTSSMWSETVNEVRVIWTNPDRDYADATAAAQDLANVNAQGGRRRSSEFRYPGVQSFALAAYLATRELNFLSRPIMKLELNVNRDGSTLRPGDAFRFQWSAWGIDAVFRVTEPKIGSLVDGTVTFIAVQDRFSVAGTLHTPPESVNDDFGGAAYPTPILLRTITEAPRWIQLKAFEAGTLANVDAQRSYSVAWPEGADDRYRVDLDGAGDLSARAFPGRFELDDVYLRTQGPYDTTGIQIRAVAGWTPTSATPTQIATEGRNLIQIDGEILAFETATFVSGATWTLDNVWRGVLDTVPADHAEGTAGYVLAAPAASVPMGSTVLVHGTSYEARTLAAAGTTWTPADESPVDTLTATSRVRRPYPVDNLTVNGSQSPAALSDDGVTMTFAKRDRTKGTITRPDAATETPEAGTAYHAVGYKGDGPLDGGTQVTLQAGIASGTTRYPPEPADQREVRRRVEQLDDHRRHRQHRQRRGLARRRRDDDHRRVGDHDADLLPGRADPGLRPGRPARAADLRRWPDGRRRERHLRGDARVARQPRQRARHRDDRGDAPGRVGPLQRRDRQPRPGHRLLAGRVLAGDRDQRRRGRHARRHRRDRVPVARRRLHRPAAQRRRVRRADRVDPERRDVADPERDPVRLGAVHPAERRRVGAAAPVDHPGGRLGAQRHRRASVRAHERCGRRHRHRDAAGARQRRQRDRLVDHRRRGQHRARRNQRLGAASAHARPARRDRHGARAARRGPGDRHTAERVLRRL